ncbi:hypothetical protein M433DRAFT_156524 [Acidomyces richmondensis BFW]|nr:MAG: hypothetical protein FE78DRAFT_89131 [Acidomyces sp. 'richmondensis']KYG43596.1 hypothetical protein M433DRAFT_156524 [Acidomyces richmondensis BFW]
MEHECHALALILLMEIYRVNYVGLSASTFPPLSISTLLVLQVWTRAHNQIILLIAAVLRLKAMVLLNVPGP